MKRFLILTFSFIGLVVFSCRKETFINSGDARLGVSVDTLRFDTVFASFGSVTQSFKIKNENNQKLRLTNISLRGGAVSPFKMNVDGIAAHEVTGIEMEANDSIYVFVSVSLLANNHHLPFIVQDSIEIGFNGNKTYVQLEAWGQNANYLRAGKITGNVTWDSNLPYVILGSLQVDTNAMLTIQKGCRIYLHADAPFIVDGTLQVNGETADSSRVYFKSDRLDYPYRDYPSGWPGIYFRGSSKDNVMNYAVIRNAFQGVVIDKPSSTSVAKLTLNQCIIDNIYDAGILAIQSSVQASNCVVSNCGKNIQLLYGGNYQFNHCTVVTYSSNYISHKEPVLTVNNYFSQGNNTVVSDLKASFVNCIFWGENTGVENEVLATRQGNSLFSVTLQNCLVKAKAPQALATTSNLIVNQEPLFDSINTQRHYYDFRLKEGSPAIGKGVNTGLAFDLDGKPRKGVPDIGAYEKQ